MSLLFRTKAPTAGAEQRSTFSLRQLALAMSEQSGGGPRVTSIDEAVRSAATWACVHVKAKGIAMLPVDVVRYDGARRIEVAKPAIIARPSPLSPSARVWRYQVAWSMFTDGNAFGLVSAIDAAGRPTQIDLLAPEDVTERKVVDGVPQAKVRDRGVERLFPFGDLWHVPGEVVAPGSPFGLSPVAYGARTTGTSLAAESFGGQFFTRGGHPTGVLTVPGQPTAEQSRELLDWLRNKANREPMVLPTGTTYETIQIDPKDSQFIELMRFEVEQECRRHGVPPSMVYGAVSGQSVTYSNVTQADLHYLKHTLSYPIDMFQDALSALLPAPRVVKFNRDAILEGDPMAKVDMHIKRVQNRLATINEVRALDDLDPFPGEEFDLPGVPPFSDNDADNGDASDDGQQPST